MNGERRNDRRQRPGRRQFLATSAAGLSMAGLVPSLLRATALGEAPARAQSVIHIFLPGGMAHQESFDPKPYAPVEYRGPFGTVKTSQDGVLFGQLFKQTAKIANKITVVRSMTHGEAAHDRGTHNMFTGYRPSPAIQFPSLGSVVSHELGSRKNLPPYVCIPNQPNEFAGSGYLSSAYGPFNLGSDPARKDFAVRDLKMPGGVDDERFARRRRLLETVDAHFAEGEVSDGIQSMDTFYSSAYSLIASPEARKAFKLEEEPEKLREEYGSNQAGLRMLLARRLVESGVRFVSLTYGGWDHHDNIKGAFERSAPALDKAYAALIRDLDQRGMLDSTLVLLTSEFGRTPKINGNDGRDHWPKVFSILLAGGGIRRGMQYGKSNATASEPEEDPLTVENLACTMYHLLGIPPEKKLMAPGGRPIDIVRGGRVVPELLA